MVFSWLNPNQEERHELKSPKVKNDRRAFVLPFLFINLSFREAKYLAVIRTDGDKDEAVKILRKYEKENHQLISDFQNEISEIDNAEIEVIAYFCDSTLQQAEAT
ncbi:MAG: hypothetical protein PHQ47_03945 [Candidatus Portnoybacteria bacterium]|nr:hypothetical protein [Candidatus Portnoybacteria bacterium]